MIHLFHDPDSSRDGDLIPHGRGLYDGAEFLGIGPHGILHVLLKDGVELVVVHNPLPRKPHDQTAVFRPADVVDLQQMLKQQAVVLLRNPVEAGERQHPGRQFSGRHLSAGGQGAHGLMVEQAVGEPLRPRRFDEALFDVELHQCDALDQVPGDHVGKHRPRLRVLLPHHKPHFRRVAPTAGSTHALQET